MEHDRPSAGPQERGLIGFVDSPEGWDARASIDSPTGAVGWTPEGQRERFEAILAALDLLPGDSVLDFGCGLGALHRMLPPGIEYTGYDWSPRMIGRASRMNPTGRFRVVWPEHQWYDHVVCCGTFNIPGSKTATWQTLRKLWERNAVSTLAASLYAGEDPDCLQYAEDEALEFGRREAFRAEVSRPRPNDVLLVMRRG